MIALLTKSSPLKLFFLLYGIPLCIVIILFWFNLFRWISIPVYASIVGTMTWLYVTGIFVHRQNSVNQKLSLTVFKVSIACVAFGILCFVMQVSFSILVLVVTLSWLYILYFVSKALTSAEFRKETGPLTYLGTFIFLSMPPIGILLVQPRIQKLHT